MRCRSTVVLAPLRCHKAPSQTNNDPALPSTGTAPPIFFPVGGQPFRCDPGTTQVAPFASVKSVNILVCNNMGQAGYGCTTSPNGQSACQFPAAVSGWHYLSHLEDVDLTIDYRVISNRSAIVETMHEGDMEMISIYHDRNDELMVTHYCSLRNQPVLNFSQRRIPLSLLLMTPPVG